MAKVSGKTGGRLMPPRQMTG